MNHTKSYIKGHPHPQFTRKGDFICLNGSWDFTFLRDNVTLEEVYSLSNGFNKQHEINVPFCYNVEKSNINIQSRHHAVAYQRIFSLTDNIKKDETYYLHFEGSDFETFVFINGSFLGKHVGGYSSFSFNLKPYLKDTNLIVVVCIDKDEAYKPRGKQSWMENPWGCWYKETIGLYKTVWLEKVNDTHINYVKINALKENDQFVFEYDVYDYTNDLELEIELSIHGKLVNKIKKPLLESHETVYLDIKNKYTGFKTQYWNFVDPQLFDIKYTLFRNNNIIDEVYSYAGFRFIETKNNMILLNNNPKYLKMILFQGYYKDKGLTGDEEDFINVIKSTKEIGLNGIRMHQKIEDDLFYYYCDIMGLLVFLEMPSPYEFNNETIKLISREYLDIINQKSNHPSIIAYVPLNESWGVPHITTSIAEQNLAKSLYYLTKAYDPFRLCIDNDGWEHTDATDIISLHNYDQLPDSLKEFYSNTSYIENDLNRVNFKQDRAAFVKGAKYHGQPIIIDEFIGTSLNNSVGWGYGCGVDSLDEYIKRFKGLIEAIKENPDIAGYCITQFNDTYQETNGLFNEDFSCKIDKDIFKKLID